MYFKKHGPSLELVLPEQSQGGRGPQPDRETARGSGNTAPLPISPLQRKQGLKFRCSNAKKKKYIYMIKRPVLSLGIVSLLKVCCGK